MTRYAVINTRHRTDSGRLAVAIDGGDQDADTTPEPPPVAPAALLIAVLRSVGDHDGESYRMKDAQHRKETPNRPENHRTGWVLLSGHQRVLLVGH